jgi:hypothetical protein
MLLCRLVTYADSLFTDKLKQCALVTMTMQLTYVNIDNIVIIDTCENKNAIPDLKRKIVKLIYIVHVVQGFKSASRIHEITVLTRTSGS